MEHIHNFSDLSERWMAEKVIFVKPTSLSAYRATVDKHLNPWFKSIDELTNLSVNQFVNSKIEKGLSPNRVKDILVVLKMIAKFGKSLGLMISWDLKTSLPKRYDSKGVELLSSSHQKILLEYLSSNFSFKNMGILLCLCTGLRIGEICGLQWKDIDLDHSLLYVNKTVIRVKTNEGTEAHKTKVIISTPKTLHSMRAVPLPSYLNEMMVKLSEKCDKESFLITNTSQPIEPRSYRYYFKKVLGKIGLPSARFHCLRHTFAMPCIENHADYKTVSSILGHADIATTLNMYVHPSVDQKRRCIEEMLGSLNT